MCQSGEFVHLHCHSDFSLLDGCARVDRLFERAEKLGMPALALTDHGNLFGLIDFYRAAKKTSVKPLLGCEIYLVTDHKNTERPPRDQHQVYHMGLLAKDYEGYQNLSMLVSDAHVVGKHYRERTDMEKLARHAKGLIGFSGCMQGVIPQAIIRGDHERAREFCDRFIQIFGRENFFIELQDHGITEQQTINPALCKLAKDFNLKVICSNDVHYVERTDTSPHEVLLCIQTGKTLEDENRMRYVKEAFYLKSREEMLKTFGEREDALTNTLEVAEMCDVKLPFGKNHYPRYDAPIDLGDRHRAKMGEILDAYVDLKNSLAKTQGGAADFSLDEATRTHVQKNGPHLLELCISGLQERYGVDYHNPDAFEPAEGQPADFAHILTRRIDYELSVIAGTGFVDYFLIVADFIRWAMEHDIAVGPGRGSGAGCLVAYLTHITDLDPMRFGLLFERFLNPERISPPDFDIDFCMRRRDEVVDYVREKYGRDAVANIITFGKFGPKMIVRDVARVMNMSFAEGDRLAKLVPDELNITMEKAVERSGELRAEVRSNPQAAQIVNYGKVIEGMVRNTGKHACGIIIGDQPLHKIIPLTLQEGDLTTQYPKEPVEDLGLLKMDFLGLKTLTIIEDAVKNVRATENPTFDMKKVPFEDGKTFELLNSGRTVGVFQLESSGMQQLCRQFQIASIDEIIALIALYRPGPMDLIPDYIRGKRDPSTVRYPHPLLEDVCRETYGIMVYQEQVMEAARIIAGYSLGQADILRRAMGKKKVELMARERIKFVKGAAEKNNINEKTATEIFAILEKFAGYGFNKSHSAAYGVLSFRTAYLKANYPVSFMAAVMSNELRDADKVRGFLDECGAMGIAVLGPDVNASGESFTPIPGKNGDPGRIRFGLGAIKGVGEGAAHKMIEEREENGPYESFRDFAARIDSRTANRRVLEHLIKAGAFDSVGEERAALLAEIEGILQEVASLQRDKERGQESFFDLLSADESPGTAPQASTNGSSRHIPPMPMEEKLFLEKELLGFYVSGHPLDAYKGLAERVNTFIGEGHEVLSDRTPFRLCAVLSACDKKISKRDNRPWAILSAATREASYTMHLYAEAYDKATAEYRRQFKAYKEREKERHKERERDDQLSEDEEPPTDPLGSGQLVMITGLVTNRRGEVLLQAEKVEPLEASLAKILRRIIWVVGSNGETPSFLRHLRKALTQAHEDIPVQLAIQLDDNQAALYDLESNWAWQFSAEGFANLARHKAVQDLHVELEPLEAPPPRWGRS